MVYLQYIYHYLPTFPITINQSWEEIYGHIPSSHGWYGFVVSLSPQKKISNFPHGIGTSHLTSIHPFSQNNGAIRNVYLGFRNGHGQRDGFGVMQPGLSKWKIEGMQTGTETMKPLAASTICLRVSVLCVTCLVSCFTCLVSCFLFNT